MRQIQSNQNGRTMLETMLYLGIIGAFAAGILLTIAKIFNNISAARSVSEFVDLVNIIYTRYSVEEDYRSLSVENLIDGKIVPDTMVSDNKIINSLNKEILINPHSSDNDIFVIQIEDVAKEDCVDYLAIKWQTEKAATLHTLEVVRQATPQELASPDYSGDGSTATLSYAWSEDDSYDVDKHLPIDPIAISNTCGSKNQITWEFN